MRLKIMIVVACLAVTGLVMASESQAVIRKSTNIPAQLLSLALQTLAKERKFQVVYVAEALRDVRTAGAVGEFTSEEALKKLLNGTGMTYRFLDEKTVTITRTDRKESSTHGGQDVAGVRVATIAEHDDAAAASSAADSENKKASREDGVEEMLVEGEREKPAPFSTANLDLTRTEDDVLPFTVFTARDIELSGAASLQEFFQNRLPQNFNSDIPDELDGSGVSHTSSADRVDMRGWGAGETVVLLNGRRLPPEYLGTETDASTVTLNLRRIPMGSIERIEILSSAGSAIYGASATGGVVNIITRQDFSGGQLLVNYASPADTHAPARGVELSYGLPFKWNTSVRVFGSYNEREPLKVSDRADITIERWRRLVMQRQPTRLISPVSGDPFRTASQPFGATPNIRAIGTNYPGPPSAPGKPGNLFADLPGSRASNFTSVPDGYNGSRNLAAFRPGVYNLDLAEGAAGINLYALQSTFGARDNKAVLGLGLDKQLGGQWRWSLDYSYSENHIIGSSGAALNFSSVNANTGGAALPRVPTAAVTNPFGQDVLVRMVDPRMRLPELDNRPGNTTTEISTTLRGSVGAWQGFGDVSYGHNRNWIVQNTFYEPNGGWRASLLNGTYNPFVDTRVAAPAGAAFYENYILQRRLVNSGTRSFQSTVKISGPLLSLPAGAMQFTSGVEWRRVDRDRMSSVTRFVDSQTGAPRTPVGLSSDISAAFAEPPSSRFTFDDYAVYAETSLPLVSDAQQLPLVRHLEVFTSGRLNQSVRNGFRHMSLGTVDGVVQYEAVPVKYTNDSHVYAFGLKHEILEGASFRVSRSLGFRPPSMSEVTPHTPLTYYGNVDPASIILDIYDARRAAPDGEVVLLFVDDFALGGNPDLKPETSESTNIGFVFNPRWAQGLRISLDYVETVRNDAIVNLDEDLIVSLEDQLPGRVRRGAPDGDPSGLGPIEFIDFTNINLNQMISRSLDISIEKQWQDVFGGRLVLTAAGTKNLSFKVQVAPGAPIEEQVRNTSAFFAQNMEQWGANGQLRWEGRNWSFGWNTRYFDYLLINPTNYLLQGDDRAPWALTHDFNLNYRLPAREQARGFRQLLSGTSLTFGVKNVFDRDPRFWALDIDRGTAPYDSITGRSVWLNVRKEL